MMIKEKRINEKHTERGNVGMSFILRVRKPRDGNKLKKFVPALA